jgi:hypothetical protein
MHSMSGNMSKEGMTKDLEAISRVGIGGVLMFNVTHTIPNGNVKFNSPEHIDILKHAAAECERLHLSFGIHNCDGWTSSGGPWVTPENSMKQVVFSEIQITGGGQVALKFPEPTARNGFYKDIAVIAYPATENEMADAAAKPIVTSSDATFDVQLATNHRSDKMTELKGSTSKPQWIQFDYGKPFCVRSVFMPYEKGIGDAGETVLLTSDDGIHFKKAAELKSQRLGKREHCFDDCFDGITARFFRIQTNAKFNIREIELRSTLFFKNRLARISMFKIEDNKLEPIQESDSKDVIQRKNIINLSNNMTENGVLKATLPAGNWTIMRFGYTITGATNSPASSEGSGLEIDKMDKKALEIHLNAYVKNVLDAAKTVAPNALQYVEIDSYEVGSQNWTQGFEKQFSNFFNYDLIPFLPLYAGKFVDNATTTNQVLWDIRNFNSKLITENYFDYFTDLCHARGLISYIEPYSFNASFNELDATKKVDIPMGEFWMHQKYQTETAVSGARIYGKNIVSAESFSANPPFNWRTHPATIKPTGDKAWTLGINEFMFHRFTHQANTNVVPGMTMSQWGSHIDRTQTWWDNAGAEWFKYLARGQYLLRQGVPVSNLLVFVGDGSPNSTVDRKSFKPAIPMHINFDCINADALINRIQAKASKLVLPNGITYDAIALANNDVLSYKTIKKLYELSQEGVIIIAKKTSTKGGFEDSDTNTDNFQQLTNAIWNNKKTYTNFNWENIFAENNIMVDMTVEGRNDVNYIHRRSETEDIYFFCNPDSVKRSFVCSFNITGKLPEFWDATTGSIRTSARFMFANNKTILPVNLEPKGSVFVVFRKPVEQAKYSTDFTAAAYEVELSLDENKQLIAKTSTNGEYKLQLNTGETKIVSATKIPAEIPLTNPWKLSFQKQSGIDTVLTLSTLKDWTSFENFDIRYYSGTAIYQTTFNLYKAALSANELILDLGEVNIVAKVIVNNKEVATLWKKPYSADIKPFVLKGKNVLTIELTNLWVNRLIGDEHYHNTSGYDVNKPTMPEWYVQNKPMPPSKRLTFTTYSFYKKTDTLMPSGLLGPVKITAVRKIEIK